MPIVVYENFLFFGRKGREPLAVFLRSSKKMKKMRECLEVSKKAVSLQPRLRKTGSEVR